MIILDTLFFIFQFTHLISMHIEQLNWRMIYSTKEIFNYHRETIISRETSFVVFATARKERKVGFLSIIVDATIVPAGRIRSFIKFESA